MLATKVRKGLRFREGGWRNALSVRFGGLVMGGDAPSLSFQTLRELYGVERFRRQVLTLVGD